MCFSSKKSTKRPTVIGSHTWIHQSQRLKFTSWKCCRSGSVKQNQLIWQFEHDRFPCLRKMASTSGSNHFTEADPKETLHRLTAYQATVYMNSPVLLIHAHSVHAIFMRSFKAYVYEVHLRWLCVKSVIFKMRAFLAVRSHTAPSLQWYSIWQDDKIEGHQLLCG